MNDEEKENAKYNKSPYPVDNEHNSSQPSNGVYGNYAGGYYG